MRTIGPATQAAIDSQIYQRDVILYVYSEDDTPIETAIPMDCLIEIPRVQATLDQVTWRMTAQIVQTDTTAALIARGRRIVAKEYLADGEPMLLFDGHIADVDESKDWSTGAYRASWTVECAGRLARALEVQLLQQKWVYSGYFPDAYGNASRLTGIIARRRSGNIDITQTATAYPLPAYAMLWFGDTTFKNWVAVYEGDGTTVISSSNYSIARNNSGYFEITFSVLPTTRQAQFDLLFVDSWVLTNHRAGSWLATIPYYQILSGTVGIGSWERLGEPGTTSITGATSPTSFRVANPLGLFASGSTPYEARYLSIWHGDTEYRGKISTVVKTAGSTYGDIALAAAPIDSSGNQLQGVSLGDRVENTTTQHYQVFDPSYMRSICYYYNGASLVQDQGMELLPVYQGGRCYYHRKALSDSNPVVIVPGYRYDAATPVAGFWNIYADLSVVDVPGLTTRDAVYTLVHATAGVLPAAGIPSSSITWEPTGLYLAPFSSTQIKAQDYIDHLRKDVLPPNYLIREEADDNNVWRTYLGYVQQNSTPDLILQGVQSIKPRQLPEQISRCMVSGGDITADRAGQIYVSSNHITNSYLLFQGKRKTGDPTASLTSPNTYGEVCFKVPQTDDGMYPSISKIVVRVSNTVTVDICGTIIQDNYLPRSTTQNDAGDAITEHVWEDVDFALYNTSSPQYLYIMFHGDTGAAIDSIEIYLKEGGFWDAQLTSDTSLAPADNGPDNFGSTWNTPDPSKRKSYRYAPIAWLRRNAAYWSASTIKGRLMRQEVQGASQGQAQEIAQSYCDQAIRSYEFEEITCSYDPRVQLTNTVGVLQEDGSIKNRLVWGINKGPKDMQLTVSDYSR